MYVAECKKWGAEADSALTERAKTVGELSRLTTLEGHYIRIFGKKDPSDRVEGLCKYNQKYAAVLPTQVHPTLQAEVTKGLKSSQKKTAK